MSEFTPTFAAELCATDGWKKLSQNKDLEELVINVTMNYERLEAFIVILKILKEHRCNYFSDNWAAYSPILINQCHKVWLNVLDDSVVKLICIALKIPENKKRFEVINDKYPLIGEFLNVLRNARPQINIKGEKIDEYHKDHANYSKHGLPVMNGMEQIAFIYELMGGKDKYTNINIEEVYIKPCKKENSESLKALIDLFNELSKCVS